MCPAKTTLYIHLNLLGYSSVFVFTDFGEFLVFLFFSGWRWRLQ